MITRLLNVALNQFSNVSVPAMQSGRVGRAERDSECDGASGGITRVLRRRCCFSRLRKGFCQRTCLQFHVVGSNRSGDELNSLAKLLCFWGVVK